MVHLRSVCKNFELDFMVLLVKNGGVISKIAIVSLMVALPLVAQQQGLVVSQPEAAPAEQPAAEPRRQKYPLVKLRGFLVYYAPILP